MRVHITNGHWGLDLHGHIRLEDGLIPTKREVVHYPVDVRAKWKSFKLCRNNSVCHRKELILAAHSNLDRNEAEEVDKPPPKAMPGYVPLQVEDRFVPE